MVGHDMTGLVDDDSGAEAALDALPVLRHEVPEKLSESGRCDPFGHQARCVHVHNGRGGELYRRGIGHPRGRRRRRCGPGSDDRSECRSATDQIRAQRHDHEGQGESPHHRAGHENEPAAQALNHSHSAWN